MKAPDVGAATDSRASERVGGRWPTRLARVRGWRWLGVAISAAMVIVACVLLYRFLETIDFAKVVASLRAMPPERILLALALVVASYVTLTFYDFFALRTIGRRDIPYHVAAMTGLMSYTIGHGVGAMALTSGYVRYRIYSAWGLGLFDIARIAFITGLTFWLGNVVVLGSALATAPEVGHAINQLPIGLNRGAGIAALIVVAIYVLWLSRGRRHVGRDHWQVTLPSARLTLVQIGIGVLDLGLAAMAMYVLLPIDGGVSAVAALVTFVVATLLGFLSHAPSGLGVFDATLLLGLPQLAPEDLLASVLMFRLLYFVLPLSVALSILALREIAPSWFARPPAAPADVSLS